MKGIDLDGRVAVVTGGARGIGHATAAELSAHGARVAIGDIDELELARAASDLGVLGVRLDVTDPASVNEFLSQIETRLGPVDIWVNNAGIMPVGPVLEQSDALIDRVVDINLLGVVWCARAAARSMAERGGGRIVNIASLSGRLPAPGTVVYSATKFAVVGLSEALDAELGSAGVRVSTIFPSFTDTGLIDGIVGGRMMEPVTPQQIGRAVVNVLRRGKRQAVIPARLSATAAWLLLPRPITNLCLRILGLDRLFLHPSSQRAGYDSRISPEEGS